MNLFYHFTVHLQNLEAATFKIKSNIKFMLQPTALTLVVIIFTKSSWIIVCTQQMTFQFLGRDGADGHPWINVIKTDSLSTLTVFELLRNTQTIWSELDETVIQLWKKYGSCNNFCFNIFWKYFLFNL